MGLIIQVALIAHHTPTFTLYYGISCVNMGFSARQFLSLWEFNHPLRLNHAWTRNTWGWSLSSPQHLKLPVHKIQSCFKICLRTHKFASITRVWVDGRVCYVLYEKRAYR